MKKITILIFCLFNSIILLAQSNQQLFLDNTWYLSKIEVNEEILIPPFTDSSEYSSLRNNVNGSNYSFSGGQCINGLGGVYTFINESSFHISEYNVTASLCPNINLEIFFGKLNSFIFWINMESNFDYSITSANNILQLVITGANGNKAYYYNNETASTKSFAGELLKIYPNPSSDFLNVSIADLDKIEIFDTTGKRIISKFSSQENQTIIDIQKLAKGNYILQITKGNQTESLKFIKK